MHFQAQLQEIEQKLNFKYPLSFVSMVEEFSSLLGTNAFRSVFPDSRLLLSAPEIGAARDRIPVSLFPFMRVEEPSGLEIYAFEISAEIPEFRVVVWSDHAIVMEWESFTAFFGWVRRFIAKNDTQA